MPLATSKIYGGGTTRAQGWWARTERDRIYPRCERACRRNYLEVPCLGSVLLVDPLKQLSVLHQVTGNKKLVADSAVGVPA